MALTGSEVVAKHKAAIGRCKGKVGFDALGCIVDEMQTEYGKK